MMIYDNCKGGTFLYQWKTGITEADVETEFRFSGI